MESGFRDIVALTFEGNTVRYDRGVILARDTIFVATLLSVPAIVGITWLLS